MLRPIALVAACGLLTACNAGASLSSGTQTFNAGVGDAVQAPLEDLNLKREEIPEVLLQARGAPYAVSGMGRCSAIGAEIARLDEALGPDIDVPTTGDGEALDQQAAGAALDAVRDTATDFIPFRSWVRRLSGAAQHSREVQSAIRAGLIRRAFLKGVGQQKNCAPPAAPYGFSARR
nr:hypothetical protein [uncultured Brevundimonas sp.]